MDTVFGVAYDGGGTFTCCRGYAVVSIWATEGDILTKMHPEKFMLLQLLFVTKQKGWVLSSSNNGIYWLGICLYFVLYAIFL